MVFPLINPELGTSYILRRIIPKTAVLTFKLALACTYAQITEFTENVAMMKVTVTEASKAFGQLVDDVQSESVTIERNGLLKGPVKAPLNNGNRAQRSAEASRARRVAQVMAVALGK